MSEFVAYRATAQAILNDHQKLASTKDENLAAAQAWALLALAEAVRDVADAIRNQPREQ